MHISSLHKVQKFSLKICYTVNECGVHFKILPYLELCLLKTVLMLVLMFCIMTWYLSWFSVFILISKAWLQQGDLRPQTASTILYVLKEMCGNKVLVNRFSHVHGEDLSDHLCYQI